MTLLSFSVLNAPPSGGDSSSADVEDAVPREVLVCCVQGNHGQTLKPFGAGGDGAPDVQPGSQVSKDYGL